MNSKKNSKSKARKGRSQSKNRTGFQSNAPAAVSDDLQQFVRFGAGKRPGSLQMSVTIPLYQISSSGSGVITIYSGGFASPAGPTTSAPPVPAVYLGIGTGLQSNAANAFSYLSPATALISNSFVRYSIQKLAFCYEPQSPTTVQDRLVFAFAADPSHPLLYEATSSAPITQGELLALSDSVAFAPWRSWEMDVSKSITQNLLYVYQKVASPSGNPNMPDLRFTCFGAIGCIPSVLAATSNVPFQVYGILYMKAVFELIEFCPIVQTAVVPIGASHKDCDDKTCPRCTRVCKHDCDESDGEEISSSTVLKKMVLHKNN